VKVGPGTLYGVFDTLAASGLIIMTKEEDRRKSYMLTATGKNVLREQIKRLGIMARNGQAIISRL